MYLHIAVFTDSIVEADNITISTMNPSDSHLKALTKSVPSCGVPRNKQTKVLKTSLYNTQ